ncbi:MAG: hypothetical protein ACFE85_04015 [Candidatus Hodarchaeota archaeon]
MEVRNNLAQKAIKFLEVAQKFEEQGELAKAIENYQTAVEFLKRSGYMMHRVEDLYARIEELKKFTQEQKKYLYMQSIAQLDKLQDQAFTILEGAEKLEKQGFIADAIKQYQSAIDLFIQAGWSETQLQNVKMKIGILGNNLNQQQIAQKDIEPLIEPQPQIMGAFGQKRDALKAEKLKVYKERKKREEEIQDQAFDFIDNAKFYEKNKKFEDAIKSYQEAIKLLESIGWQEQINNLRIVVDRLKRDKIEFERFQAQREIGETSPVIEPQETPEKFKTLEFQEQLDTEDQIQTEAFNLIDIAKKLEREKKYEKAVENYQNAIYLLKSIKWDSYVQPIINFINDIKEKQKAEDKLEDLAKKRENETRSIQETIFLKERDEIVQSVKDLQKKRTEFQQKRKDELEKEEKFYTILDRADKILNKNKDFDTAIKEYKQALDFLITMDSSWQPYVKTINSTISSVKKLKEAEIEKELEEKKQLEAIKLRDLEFQQKLSAELQRELKYLRKKEIDFQIRKDELKYREERKQGAFKLLEAAQDYINKGDLDNAIIAYQNVGSIFAGIQWYEEIPIIENAIFELERRKKEEDLKKYKDIQKSIEKSKLEKEFQEKIAKQMQIERERLKLKEISLREREKEIKYREKRKQDAFKILQEAQIHINQGEYEKTTELYNIATNIFAEIHWYEEVELIGKAVIEIENKRREDELKKQKEMYNQLEKEKNERAFQQKIINEMKIQKERLKQRRIEIKEKEKEIEYQENKKQEAFHFIDVAHNYLSLGKFDEAIETYRNVADIFAQIQWINEIPLIKQAIREIEIKQKERELLKQRTMQQAIEKEAENRQFIMQIQKQREIEKLKDIQKKELIEKRKSFSNEIIKKQEEAFKIIEEADNSLKKEQFDLAEETYNKAIRILNEIGWLGSYMKLLEETIQTIRVKKREKERRYLEEKQLAKKILEEEKTFERKITEEIMKEQARLKAKKIEFIKREETLKQIELLKSDAFDLMDKAEVLLYRGLYEQSIELYFQAELTLSEINYPTDAIKEMIQKIQEKKREEDISKQYELERKIRKQEEERLFQAKIAEGMKLEQQRMKTKQIKLMQQNELKEYMERRKQDAFELLDNADLFVKKSEYNKALEYYRSAELILNEIQFPTTSLKELILEIKEKRREQEFEKQKAIELKIQKEQEELKFQTNIAESLRKEKARLQDKQIEIAKLDELKVMLEQKREEAFKVLDDAEVALKDTKYDESIALYRKGMMLLNEIQFPTDSINATILKIMSLKKQKALEEELSLKRELEKIEEEKKLAALFEERKKKEEEARLVKELALKQREKLVQEQITHREVAYSLLEEAGKYLKKRLPDFDSAISLYLQARDLLAEKIGWEPEINNLNILIKDLQEEKTQLIEKQNLEKQLYLKRQREYKLFQEEIQKRKEEFDRKKKEQELKLKELLKIRQQTEIIKVEGFSLIDKGKQFAAYHNFENAYNAFKEAINKFNQIGWHEQTKYVQKEIDNTKNLQKKVEREELEVKKIYEDLKQKKISDELKLKEKEKELEKTITEVGSLTGEISNLIDIKKKEFILDKEREKERIKYEAKEFREKMGDLIKLKQELTSELAKSKKKMESEKERERIKKDKEKADEIKKMLKDVANKNKE